MACLGRLVVVCVCWLAVWQAGASSHHIPHDMSNNINNLLKHYEIPDRFDGTPVFSIDFLNKTLLEDSDRRVLMGGVLLVYKKLIGRMLEQVTATGSASSPAQPRHDKVEEQLRYLLDRVQNLMRHHYQEQTKLLQNLWDVQIDDSVVQSKALIQFKRFYTEASSLITSGQEKIMKRRRRRQLIMRTKKHL